MGTSFPERRGYTALYHSVYLLAVFDDGAPVLRGYSTYRVAYRL